MLRIKSPTYIIQESMHLKNFGWPPFSFIWRGLLSFIINFIIFKNKEIVVLLRLILLFIINNYVLYYFIKKILGFIFNKYLWPVIRFDTVFKNCVLYYFFKDIFGWNPKCSISTGRQHLHKYLIQFWKIYRIP